MCEVVQRCIKRTKKHNPELKIKSEVFNDQSNHVAQSSIMSQKSPHNEESFTINQSDADENDDGDVKPDKAELDSFLSSKTPIHVEVDGDNTSNDATEKFVPTQDGISDESDLIGTQNRRSGRPKRLTSSNAEKLPDRKRKYTRDVSSELEFECALCGDNFCSTNQLRNHMASRHTSPEEERTCKECDKTFMSSRNLRQHQIRVHITNVTCNICGQAFKYKVELQEHKAMHCGRKSYSCPKCNKTFFRLANLDTHLQITHNSGRFQCHICKKEYGRKQSRDYHVIASHERVLPHKCEYCGKGFTRLLDLKRHTFIHTRVSDFVCNTCGRQFANGGTLNRHIRLDHNGEKKLCPICGKHIKRSLSGHMRSHGEKKFKCNLCDKAYARPEALKEHMPSHFGKKPFQCPKCPKSFLGSANFSKHKKIHEKNEKAGKVMPIRK